MKFVFLLGGAAGFVTAIATDLLLGRGPDRVLFDGAVGCLAGALLLRWFWRVLLAGIRDTYVARQRAALTAAAAATTVTAAPPSQPAAAPKAPAKLKS
jgi:hypothetical protein